jgi:hypothetical protein
MRAASPVNNKIHKGRRQASARGKSGGRSRSRSENQASFQLYFLTGTLDGKYVLTPQEGNFSPTTFTETDYLGTLTITGGTGAYKGAKGTGTMTCTTPDGIHTTCTDKLKLKKI